MRFGLVAAMAAVTLLSGCEFFLDGMGFEMFSKSPIVEAPAGELAGGAVEAELITLDL